MKSDLDPTSDDALPPALLADLQRMQRTPTVPPAVDRRIQAAGQAYFSRQRRIRLWVRVSGGLAAAVLVVVGVRLAMPPAQHELSPQMAVNQQKSPPPLVDAAILKHDIDRNRVVDILDALTVARGIKTNQVNAAWDVTGDGSVDRQDIDQIATAAVAVKGGVQ